MSLIMPRSFRNILTIIFLYILVINSSSGATRNSYINLLFTADSRGEIEPCQDCTSQAQHGGLAQRSSVVNRLREKNLMLILVDTGNTFFGTDSFPSQGQVMVGAYNVIHYDAINLSYRDFRLGKTSTLDLLKEVKFPVISANLLDNVTGEPLVKPYIMKTIGSYRIALIGVTQSPAGLKFLPHLQQQLAGIRIEPPLMAVEKWLPKAKAAADHVILLYYGSWAGLKPIKEKFGSELAAILVGGSRAEYLPTDSVPPIIGTSGDGQHVALIKLNLAGEQVKAEVKQIPIDASIPPDPEIQKLVGSYLSNEKKSDNRATTHGTLGLAQTDTDTVTSLNNTQNKSSPIGKSPSSNQSKRIIIGKDLRIGMPLTEAMGLLGFPGNVRAPDSTTGGKGWIDYPKLGLAIASRQGGKTVEAIEFHSGFKGQFDNGLKIGDPFTTVLGQYGMPASMTPQEAVYPEKGMTFRFQDQKVIGILLELPDSMATKAPESEVTEIEQRELPVLPTFIRPPSETIKDKTVEKPQIQPKAPITSANNKAVKISVLGFEERDSIEGKTAPEGMKFLVLNTRWQNIHPKQKVDKDRLEGKRDISMGVGGLGWGGSSKPKEFVEMDVTYQIPRLLDHAYVLADGLAYGLHAVTDVIQDGFSRGNKFSLAKHGEVREGQLVYTIPSDTRAFALQYFDYSYGQIEVPIQGKIAEARQFSDPVLAKSHTKPLDLLVKSIDFRPAYQDQQAPTGWRYAVIGMGGKSLLGTPTMGQILQIAPRKYTWIRTEDGYLYYSAGSATAEQDMLRFTPEIHAYQELAFLLPEDVDKFDLGFRLKNNVVWLTLSEKGLSQMPEPVSSHRDNDIMEVHVYGVRSEAGRQIVDVGIQSLEKQQGIEIQTRSRFSLFTKKGKVRLDIMATRELPHRPPVPSIIPPDTFLRFELAFKTSEQPQALHFRGLKSEARLALESPQQNKIVAKGTAIKDKRQAIEQSTGTTDLNKKADNKGAVKHKNLAPFGSPKVSSSNNGGYSSSRAIDGKLETSWFTADGDAANKGKTPFFELVFDKDATISKLRMYGNRQYANGYDFYSGVFQLFDRSGKELYNSGIIELPAPHRDITLALPNISNVRRVRFYSVSDESVEPGFAELEVMGEFEALSDRQITGKTEKQSQESGSTQAKGDESSVSFGGHWYQAISMSEGGTWQEAKLLAEAMGGYLASITNAEENEFVYNLAAENKELWFKDEWNNGKGPWIGGMQLRGCPKPDYGWVWPTGERWTYTNWYPDGPDDKPGGRQDRLHLIGYRKPSGGSHWNDIQASYKLKGFVVEWDNVKRGIKAENNKVLTPILPQAEKTLLERKIAVKRTYTLDKDFDEGSLLNLNHDAPNNHQLQLNEKVEPFPYVNVAASKRGTIVKINANTGDVVGEYRTAPEGRALNPSRTTVDLFGNVWSGNRDEDKNKQGSVVKVGLIIGGMRVDAEGKQDQEGHYLAPPYRYSTCVDRDEDGLIKTSQGLGDILSWKDKTDGKGGETGLVEDAEDECILVYQLSSTFHTRHVSVDANNDVWIGGYSSGGYENWFNKLDEETGRVLDSFDARKLGCGGYGGLIDGDNILWSANYGSSKLLRYDLNKKTGECTRISGSYGLGIDTEGNIWHSTYGDNTVWNVSAGKEYPTCGAAQDRGVAITPVDNHVWVANSGGTSVSRLDNRGNILKLVEVGKMPTGVAVDGNGKVWVTNQRSDSVMRIDPNAGFDGLGEVDLTVDLGKGAAPYNYSDMTGMVALTATSRQGTWRFVQDTGVLDDKPVQITWNTESEGKQPSGTQIKIQIRAAGTETGLTEKSFVDIANGQPINIYGRIVEVRAVLKANKEGESPVLSDLTIDRSEEIIFNLMCPEPSRKADFVFLIDGTNSMDEEIDSVRKGLNSFVDRLEAQQVDARFAVVMFGGPPELVLDFTQDPHKVRTALNKISVYGAVSDFQENHNVNPEAGLEAIRTVLNSGSSGLHHNYVGGDGRLHFRPDARINLILVTDENSDRPYYSGNRFPGQRNQDPPTKISTTDWQREVDRTAQSVVRHQAFLNMLISTDDTPSRHQYGDPSSDVSEENLLGFNAEATRKQLRINGFGKSLEAQVLDADMIARSFDIKRVNDPNFVKNFYDAKVREILIHCKKKKPIRPKGKGYLSVAATHDVLVGTHPTQVELILDASGSMRERKRKIDGRLKIDVAKEVLHELIDGLPEGIEVGLRVYGHRIREGRKGDCQDTELLVPFGALDKDRLHQQVAGMQALGTTPLTYSLLKAAEDFSARPGEKILILVTDGKEECKMDPAFAAKTLVSKGLNVRVDVVGFALAEEKTKTDMRQVAAITGGRFYDAQDRSELLAALRRALSLPYKVFNSDGKLVATGTTGEGAKKLRDGVYSVKVQTPGRLLEFKDVRVAQNRYTRLELHMDQKKVKPHILGPSTKEAAEQSLIKGEPMQSSIMLDKTSALQATLLETPYGLRVEQVSSQGLAQKARLQRDDLLTHIDGIPLRHEIDLRRILKLVHSGKKETTTITIRRAADVIVLEVRGKVKALWSIEPIKKPMSRSNRVRSAQGWLSLLGFNPGPADGLWGHKTERAISDFQRWYPDGRLNVTGQLDEKTYLALESGAKRGLKRSSTSQSSKSSALTEQQRREIERQRQAEQRRKSAEEQQRQKQMIDQGIDFMRKIWGR